MKTYTKQITVIKPKLVINYDENADSPREWSNLGYFITVDSQYRSPDDNNGTIYNIVKQTGNEASNINEHIKLIKKEIKEETGEKVIAIYPVNKYEHSGIVYRMGTANGFDYSNNGFYIITDKTQKETGIKKKNFVEAIKEELEVYTKWCNGKVYEFCLYDNNGEVTDSCGGFFSINDIKGYLPKEWKDENLSDYFKN